MPSRTYTIKMDWIGSGDPIVLEQDVQYRIAIQFLNDLQGSWSKRGITEVVRWRHNVLTVHKLKVWFEEEHHAEEQAG